MTGPQRRFDPAELRAPGEPEPSVAELADALAAARELEALSTDVGIRPTEGFADRVMAAIATEPAPRLVVKPASAVRGGRVGAFVVAVRDSWGVATTGGRPMAVRMQALAFVFLVILAASALTGVTALTVGALIGPNGPTTAPDQSSNPVTTPAPFVSPTSLDPTDAAQPSESPGPTETPESSESAEPGESSEPTETSEAEKTAKPTETPKTTRTPRPTETPEAEETPEGTDDHGGSGSDDGGGSDDHGGGSGPG